MMKEKDVEKLLNEMADMTAEPARPGLAEDIKNQIPRELIPPKGGMDTISIIINLKINKLAAAAAIIITVIIVVSFLGVNTAGEGIFQDGKLLLRHYLAGEGSTSDDLAGMSKLYECLVSQGKDVVYYGDSLDPEDSYGILMQWKIADDTYNVILVNFGTLSLKTVNAEQLIDLQRRMLQKKTK